MNTQQALQILTNATENIQLSYRDHMTVKDALQTLANAVEELNEKTSDK